jgi:hypothetical protein
MEAPTEPASMRPFPLVDLAELELTDAQRVVRATREAVRYAGRDVRLRILLLDAVACLVCRTDPELVA